MDPNELALAHWRSPDRTAGLTWGTMLDGDACVAALASHAKIEGAAMLEIGPGYGRLLRSLLVRSVPFARYVGLDISAHWTRELVEEFGDRSNAELVRGAAEEAAWLLAGRRFDLIVSFLTWKHFYPDFGAVARGCWKLLAIEGRLIFDLPETGVAWPIRPDDINGSFNRDTGTFTRHYSRPQIASLLSGAGFSTCTFDEIEHTPGKRRLLVEATRTEPRRE